MDLDIVKDSKEELEVKIGSLTLAEILRVYLNKDSAVSFVAWKRDHPTEKPTLAIKTKGKSPKKALNDAINSITKDLDKILSDFSKLK